MKKIIYGIFIFLCTCTVAISAVVFFVDFTVFKPQIQNYVKEKTNLTVDFSHLKACVWGGLGATFEDVSIVDTTKETPGWQARDIERVHIGVDLWSVLKDDPQGIVRIKSSLVNIEFPAKNKKDRAIALSMVQLNGLWSKNKFLLEKFVFKIWNGDATLTGQYETAPELVSVQTELNLSNIDAVRAAKFWNVDMSKVFKGNISAHMNMSSKASGTHQILPKMVADGTYSVSDGVMYTTRIKESILAKLNEYIKRNSVWQNHFTMKQFDQMLNTPAEISLGKVEGKFDIENEKTNIITNINNDYGVLFGSGSSDFTGMFMGNLLYTMSPSFKKELIAKNSSMAYLVDPKGQVVVSAKVSGNPKDFIIDVDMDSLQKTISDNTSKDVKKQIKDKISSEMERHPELKDFEKKAKKLLLDNGIDLKKLGF